MLKKLLVLVGGGAAVYFVVRSRSAQAAVQVPAEMVPQVYAALPQPRVQQIVSTAEVKSQAPIAIRNDGGAAVKAGIMASRIRVG